MNIKYKIYNKLYNLKFKEFSLMITIYKYYYI